MLHLPLFSFSYPHSESHGTLTTAILMFAGVVDVISTFPTAPFASAQRYCNIGPTTDVLLPVAEIVTSCPARCAALHGHVFELNVTFCDVLLFLMNTSVLLVVLIGAWSLAVACVNVSVAPSSVGWIGVNVFNAVIFYPSRFLECERAVAL